MVFIAGFEMGVMRSVMSGAGCFVGGFSPILVKFRFTVLVKFLGFGGFSPSRRPHPPFCQLF